MLTRHGQNDVYINIPLNRGAFKAIESLRTFSRVRDSDPHCCRHLAFRLNGGAHCSLACLHDDLISDLSVDADWGWTKT
jgi:hypothetical protein